MDAMLQYLSNKQGILKAQLVATQTALKSAETEEDKDILLSQIQEIEEDLTYTEKEIEYEKAYILIAII